MTGGQNADNISEVSLKTIDRSAQLVLKNKMNLAADGGDRRVTRRDEFHGYSRCYSRRVVRRLNTTMQRARDVFLREDIHENERA